MGTSRLRFVSPVWGVDPGLFLTDAADQAAGLDGIGGRVAKLVLDGGTAAIEDEDFQRCPSWLSVVSVPGRGRMP